MRCKGLPFLCLPFTTIVPLSHHTLLCSILLTTDAVVVSIFQNSMLDANQLLMEPEGGSLALALCGQTTIYWLLDDRLLSFPRRGTDALGLVAASPPRRLRVGRRLVNVVVRGNGLCARAPACLRTPFNLCPYARGLCDTCVMVEVRVCN